MCGFVVGYSKIPQENLYLYHYFVNPEDSTNRQIIFVSVFNTGSDCFGIVKTNNYMLFLRVS